jgi:hypothetical protein
MKLFKQFSVYESEATLFLKDLKKKNPAIEKNQQKGRALLWDKAPMNLDEQKRISESKVPQKAYVYFSHTGGK